MKKKLKRKNAEGTYGIAELAYRLLLKIGI